MERAERDALVQMLDTSTRYWLALGELFDGYLARLATTPLAELPQVRAAWQNDIRRAAERALQSAINSLVANARTWQALAEAETVLRYGTLYPTSTKSTPIPNP